MRDHRSENHPAPRRLLFTPGRLLFGKPVLDINISFFQDADAVASRHHVLGGVHQNLDDDGTFYFLFHARGGVFPAHAAGLVEHVWGHFTQVRANEYLRFQHYFKIKGSTKCLIICYNRDYKLYLGTHILFICVICANSTRFYLMCCTLTCSVVGLSYPFSCTIGNPFPLRSLTAPLLPSVWYRARCCCSG